MVNAICILFLFFFWNLPAQEIKINAQVDQYHTFENQPIKGTIQVTHEVPIPVESLQFIMEGKPLKVQFENSVRISPDYPLTVSQFRFELDGLPKGLHILPEISLTVKGKTYQSIPSTYEVLSSPSEAIEPTKPHKPSAISQSFLKLEAKVEGTMPIYPGQRLKSIYKYIYHGDIELTKELLPLLNPEGFIKIGQKEINDFEENGISIRQISQVVEATKGGNYSFGPSILEGFAYDEDEQGRRIGKKKELKAEAPAINIVVSSFPEKGKPASFNGAVGQLNFQVTLQTPSEVMVGDKIQLAIDISGKTTDWNQIFLPELCCQPGYSGLFQLSDLSPQSEISGPNKRFLVEMRPLSTQITEIPSIEFSYFDPEKKNYVVIQSAPIPIVIKAAPETQEMPIQIPYPINQQQPIEPQLQKPQQPQLPEEIEIRSVEKLSRSDLYNLYFGTRWVLLLIPFGIGVIFFQIHLKESIEKKKKEIKPKTSEELLTEVFKQDLQSLSFYHELSQAFLLRLYERKEIASPNMTPQQLPKTGFAGEVRSFLCEIEEKRFARKEVISREKLIEQAQALFQKGKQ